LKVSKVISAYTNNGKTTLDKRERGRKLTLTERDHHAFRRTISKNDTNTAAQVNCRIEYSS
jgi:hypothetical protein